MEAEQSREEERRAVAAAKQDKDEYKKIVLKVPITEVGKQTTSRRVFSFPAPAQAHQFQQADGKERERGEAAASPTGTSAGTKSGDSTRLKPPLETPYTLLATSC